MEIKVALAAALLVALLALAGATTFTTTVTTTSIDDEANPGYRQCSQQLQGRQFQACQRYLTQGSYGPYEEEEEVLRMATENPGQQEYSVQECCQSLRQVDQQQQCGCEAIKKVVRQVQQRGGGRQMTGQSEQVYQMARDLPRICSLRSQQCQINVVFL